MLAVSFKAISTLDSMIGHKSQRYLYFGWCAAKLDTIANYIPARITGLLISNKSKTSYFSLAQRAIVKEGYSNQGLWEFPWFEYKIYTHSSVYPSAKFAVSAGIKDSVT